MINKKGDMMIDTHAHLNMKDFSQDIEQIIEKAKANGLKHIIVIGMDEASSLQAIELAETYEMVYATVGLHPGYVDGCDVSHIENLLNHPKVVGVGECGLDFYWTDENQAQQEQAFLHQIKLSEKYQLPLVIHTRNSFDRAYEMVQPFKGKVNGVFHCFSSTLEDVIKAIDIGFYIGIDGPITFKKNEVLKDIILGMDLSYLLIETDSPYMTPAPHRGKRNEPSYLPYIAEKIAEIKGITVDEVINITTENAKRLFTKIGGNKT